MNIAFDGVWESCERSKWSVWAERLLLLLLIIIIIIIIIISFMQGIYTYFPETNYVPTEYSVAAVLLLLFMVLISLVPVLNLLYFYIILYYIILYYIIIIIISNLSNDRSKASSKTIPPHSAI